MCNKFHQVPKNCLSSNMFICYLLERKNKTLASFLDLLYILLQCIFTQIWMYFLLSNDLLTHSGFSPCPCGLIKTFLFSGKLSLSNRLHSSFCLFVAFIWKDSLYFFLFKKTLFIYMFICAWNPKCYALSLLHWYCLFVFDWRKRKAPQGDAAVLLCSKHAWWQKQWTQSVSLRCS